METSEQIDYLVPLLEDPTDALLMEMRTPAPYVVPEKKVKKKAIGTRKSARRPEVSDSSSDESKTHSSREDDEEEEETLLLQRGKGRKGRPPSLGRPKGPRRGKPFLRTTPPTPTKAERSGRSGQAPGEIVSIRIPE